MLNFLKTILNSTSDKPAIRPVEDPTVYYVETSIGNYCGRILYQDDVAIKLRITKPKPVKILKSNIAKIRMAQPDQALEFNRWYEKNKEHWKHE